MYRMILIKCGQEITPYTISSLNYFPGLLVMPQMVVVVPIHSPSFIVENLFHC